LTALIGFIETLQGPARDDPAARDRFLSIMAAEAGRMGRLVEDLLSLRQVEDQERVRPTAPVNLGGLVDSVVRTLGPMAVRAGVTVTLDRPDAVPDIPGDAGQLQQVLTNLLDNAVKYGAAGGTVTVGLAGPGEEPDLQGQGMRIWVADQGDGIAAHHIGRLTERFYRVDSHRSRAVGGTGLGLAIVKHIVTRHRGRLKIESTPGMGTRFTILLPASI
jgi:two-component system phosphate regulon sensor histidine kinase PhoR